MAERIPDEWKSAVIDILEEGNEERIEVRLTTALLPFGDLFPGAFNYELYDAFVDGLSDTDIEGRQIHDMEDEGTTWAFIFTHQRKKIFGKVCLTPGDKVVIIISAHAPYKGDKV